MPEPTPSPAFVYTLDFTAALAAVRRGERISKQEWHDDNSYATLRDGKLMLHLADGWHDWIISAADMAGVDWFALPQD